MTEQPSVAVPQALRDERRWICWGHRDGRKPPLGPDGRPSTTWNQPASWMAYDEAVALYASRDDIDGIGFVLGGGWAGLDLDDCRADANSPLDPQAAGILAAMPEAYAEWSPSGHGCKVLGRGTRWLEVNVRTKVVQFKASGYFAITGDALPGRTQVLDLDKALTAIAGMYGGASTPGVVDAGDLAKPGTPAPPLPKVVAPGAQEGAMFREAARLRRMGYEEATIAATLWGLVREGRFPNEPGREPWTQADCEAKARGVMRYEPTQDVYGTTDADVAEYFSRVLGDRLRYDHVHARWLLYDGVRWAPDMAHAVVATFIDFARTRINAAGPQVGADRLRGLRKYLELGKMKSALETSTALRPIANDGSGWDTDPWLLGVPNGVVDLRDGTLRDGRPEDHITMQCDVPYDPQAKAPLWEATVASIFSDKPEGFVPYLQRALGYSITGRMDEETFWLLVGTGRNGKGTIINTVHRVLGTYADSLRFASLEQSTHSGGGGGATPDLAKLEGKRFVVASEGSGAALYTALIKQITGRDPMTTRALYQAERTFTPTLKLWLTTQSEKRPRVRDDSDGFWSRPHEVQFAQSFKDKADTTLKDRLYGEAQGILTWLVQGAVAWYTTGGLRPPACVTQAVQEYRLSQEPLADFYDMACVLEPSAQSTFSDLYGAYQAWGKRMGRHMLLGTTKFGRELGKRFNSRRERVGGAFHVVYQGVGVAQHDPGPQGPPSERQPGEDTEGVPF